MIVMGIGNYPLSTSIEYETTVTGQRLITFSVLEYPEAEHLGCLVDLSSFGLVLRGERIGVVPLFPEIAPRAETSPANFPSGTHDSTLQRDYDRSPYQSLSSGEILGI